MNVAANYETHLKINTFQKPQPNIRSQIEITILSFAVNREMFKYLLKFKAQHQILLGALFHAQAY